MIPLHGDHELSCYSDASLGSLEDGWTQLGVVILIKNKNENRKNYKCYKLSKSVIEEYLAKYFQIDKKDINKLFIDNYTYEENDSGIESDE